MVDLVGRDDELAAGVGRLRDSGRLVIVGPGGIGKTSLARALADRVSHEVVVVLADGLQHADAILALAVDNVARRREDLDRSGVTDDSADDLAARLRDRAVALVLDGVDEVVDDLLASVGRIPAGGSGPWVVMTSRVRPAATDWPVQVLGPLSGRRPTGTHAALFAARYASAGGDLGLLTSAADEVTQLLADAAGVPLAIEVAAAHAAVMGFAGVGSGSSGTIDDVVGRSIERSLAGLPDAAAGLFAALGVTSGSVPVSLAAALVDAPGQQVAAALEVLVRHSLLVAVAGGFSMLPPIHRHAQRVAARAGDSEAVRRHRDWCLAHARLTVTMGEAASLLRVAPDLRLAADRAVVVGELDDALRLVFALDDAFRLQMHHRRREELLSAILAGMPPDATVQRGELLRRLALVRADTTGLAAARACLDDAARTLAGLDVDHPLRVDVARVRAAVRAEAGDPAGAVATLHDAAARSAARGDVEGELHARRFAANALLDLGRLDDAEWQAQRVVDIAGTDLPELRLLGLDSRAMIALERGDHARCAALGRIMVTASSNEERRRDGHYLQLVADPARMVHEPPWSDQPGAIPGATSFQLLTELGRTIRLLVLGDAEGALAVATAAAVAAEGRQVMWAMLDGLLLAGDAALLLDDPVQSAICHRQALDLAHRHHHILRVADALDGLARGRTGRIGTEAAATAADLRRSLGAAPHRRPWLPSDGPIRPDSRWTNHGRLTSAGLARFRAQDGHSTADPRSALSPAEQRVAALVVEGCTNREIAERLFIGRRTVESHLLHAFQKLDVANRTQLAMKIAVRVQR